MGPVGSSCFMGRAKSVRARSSHKTTANSSTGKLQAINDLIITNGRAEGDFYTLVTGMGRKSEIVIVGFCLATPQAFCKIVQLKTGRESKKENGCGKRFNFKELGKSVAFVIIII